jgi:LacI family transcriptional regulator
VAMTSFDVARLAGVSQPTVSRALRGDSGVAPETRMRVERAAAELGYVTSHLGRGLATRTTRRIGIVAAELTDPFYAQIVERLQSELEQAGYRSVLFVDRGDDAVTVHELADGSLDGVVLTTSCLDSAAPGALSARRMPFVLFNGDVDGVLSDAAVVDNFGGAALVADFLVQLGHDRIGAVFGPDCTSAGRDRERGFRQALAAKGRPLSPRLTTRVPISFEQGATSVQALMSHEEQATALFCTNDVLALGALDAATRLGMRVPEDLTVMGFDDINLASWARFDLTTVSCDLARLAALAAELLLKRIADPQGYHHRIVVPTELVLRGSHAPPPS